MLCRESNGLSAETYKHLVEVGLALEAEESDLQRLFFRILDFSLDLAKADAGSIYVVRKGELEFSCWRNKTFEKQNRKVELGRHHVPINNDTICGYVASTGATLLLEDVNKITGGSPYHFSDQFDRLYEYQTKSMITMPLTIPGGNIVGVLQLINYIGDGAILPFPPGLLAPLRILSRQAALSLHNAALSEELKNSQLETVYRLALAAETRDNETGLHLKRVSHYARLLAHQFGKGEDYENLIYNAAPLHDVGKIGLPDCILKKAARFTDDERAIMQTHSQLGRNILEGSQSPLLQLGAMIAFTHHEKWNGTGYPQRLQAADIPFEGRLMAVVDVFDALSCKRCYKQAWPMENVIETINKDKSQHFDPEMVDAFMEVLPEFLKIYEQFKD